MVKNNIFLILIGILCVAAITGCGRKTADFVNTNTQPDTETVEMPSVAETESETDSSIPSLYVYICGAVVSPGVYELPAGSRVHDAFVMAGGFADDAAVEYWNQARPLLDGEMIYVPTIEEAADRSQEEWNSAGGMGDSTEPSQQKKININTATREELMTLPGIGESKALTILAYRKEHGRFAGIEDLMQIPGIKEAVFSKIQDYITVD